MRATQLPHDRRHADRELRFLTIGEVAELVQVAPRTVSRWIKAGDLVAHRVGSIVRIADDDLRAFLATYREA